jgi:hypothetical protein
MKDELSRDRQIYQLIKKGIDSLTNFFSSPKVEISGASLITIKGEQGKPGEPGQRGNDGKQGERGERGDKGDKGEKGEKGERGERGEKGEKGDKGEKGEKGDKGEKGEQGKDGKDLELTDDYIKKVSYALDERLRPAVVKQFGGGNNVPIDAYGPNGLIGGAREIEFTGDGVGTELVNNRLIVTVLGGGAYIVDDEIPSGAINNSNVLFTLANTPNPSTSVKVFLNGQKLVPGTDFTVSGDEITMAVAPQTDIDHTDVITVDYRYI